jgi:GNAT superfamily N-acetyltransferase
MSYLIRQANRNDIPRLEELLGDYMQELFHRAWGGTTQLLEQQGFGNEVTIIVAEASGQGVVAFVAWISSYDLHHCMSGGEVIDLYVARPQRGRGLAMRLMADVAMRIGSAGAHT